jgi:hypothetical protein
VSAIKCTLLYHSLSAHLQQLYTGFVMLHRSGIIELDQERTHAKWAYANSAPHLANAHRAHLTVVVNESMHLHFDTHDAIEVLAEAANACDWYFKRSYSSIYIRALPEHIRDKIVPLGLNYNVMPDVIDFYALRRELFAGGSLREKVAAFMRAVDVRNIQGFRPRVGLMETAPDYKAAPRTLFLVAAYDPYDDPARSPEKIEDRRSINLTRANCIGLLRSELGPDFVGGFIQSRFAVQTYPDLVVPAAWTIQSNYIERLQSWPICIATTGLHGSIGWKLAEYVAFSKAIVSEKLRYEVPGQFEPGKNYLEFTSPEECLSAVRKLTADSSLRNELMRNNAAYYQRYLRPDSLVLNALKVALK